MDTDPVKEVYKEFNIVGRLETSPQRRIIVEACKDDYCLTIHTQAITVDDFAKANNLIAAMIPGMKVCIDGYLKYLDNQKLLKGKTL